MESRTADEVATAGRLLAVTIADPTAEASLLPFIEIVPDDPPGTTGSLAPTATLSVAELTASDGDAVEKAARRASAAAGCRDLMRVDIMLSASGAAQVVAVDTAPSLEAIGPVSLAITAAGLTRRQITPS